MGLPIKTLAKQATALAFNLASDLVSASAYKHPTDSRYNPATGVVDPQVTSVSVKAMILNFSEEEIDGTVVKLGDERILIQCSQLPDFTPGTDDTIEIGEVIRRVISFDRDAANAAYRFHCRREIQA